jgi:hypothetical protein
MNPTLRFLRTLGLGLLLAAIVASPAIWESTRPAKAQAPAGGPYQVWPAGTVITGNATGTTGAVVGTLAGVAGKTTNLCGFNVSAAGGTATIFPITVAGTLTASQVYQGPTNIATGILAVTQTFWPCVPASAVNTAITITTTANGTATAVDVNSWGYQL